MRDPYTSNQGSEAGHHPDSISPAQVMVPDTMLAPFTGRAPGRSYAVQFAVGVVALGGLALLGYQMMQPPQPGTIVLNTRPTDVTVSVDGKSLTGQASPITLDGISANVEHVLEIKKDGFKPQTQRITAKPGEVMQLPFVVLEPLVVETGFTLESTPAGANVLIDGKPIEQVTPVKVTDLAPGEHTLRVEHGLAFKPWEGQVTATAGQVASLPAVTLTALSPSEVKKAERAAKLQAKRDKLAAAKAAKGAKSAKPANDDAEQ